MKKQISNKVQMELVQVLIQDLLDKADNFKVEIHPEILTTMLFKQAAKILLKECKEKPEQYIIAINKNYKRMIDMFYYNRK